MRTDRARAFALFFAGAFDNLASLLNILADAGDGVAAGEDQRDCGQGE
jgi:hypothetical protein